jgi:hypothetical protein
MNARLFKLLLLTLSVMLAAAANGYSQFFSWGQDPASVRWSQIETENFQVIFPEEYHEHGAYIADVLEYANKHASNTLGHQPRKISVIIHNRTVVPNGFVSWAPRRLEMFTNPPQSNDNHDWLERLAVHEYRHVVQVDKLHQGLTRMLAVLLGEQATGIVLGLYVPLWFLEGDAVAVETALTFGGRGRLPVFEQGLRAQVLERGTYSFDKAVFGSYRDHVPNHYELGYQLVASARVLNHAMVWDPVINNVARRPYSITPFSGELKRQTGRGKVDHYHHTFSYLDSAWTAQRESHDYTGFRQVNASHDLFTSYRHLAFLDEETLMAYKTGLGDIPRVVAVGLDGTERVLFSPGLVNAYAFSAGGGIIAWSEVRTDPRWELRSWSEIFTYDIATGRRQKVTRGTRYFAPAVSRDGSRIAVVSVSKLNEYGIVVLDVQSGAVLQELSTPENDFLMTPAWHPDGNTLAAIAVNEAGKRIVLIDLPSASFSDIFPAGHVEISRPAFIGNDIYFNGAYSGIDNVYRLNFRTGRVEKIISSEFGGIDAAFSPDGSKVAWSDYSSRGYAIALATTDALQTMPLEAVENHSVAFHETLAAQETSVITHSNIPRMDRDVKPYSRLANLFHLHSWGPFALDVNNMEAVPGASLFFQNKLSTSFATLGYEYDLNEETGKYFVNYSYQGWYPVVDLQAETGERISYYRDQEQQLIALPWRENSLRLGLTVPLTFRRNNYFYGLMPTIRTGIIQARTVAGSPDALQNNDIWNMQYRLLAYRQVFSVRRDMRPRWGQILDVNYRHTPFGGADMGYVVSARATGFFPGLVRHHSLRLGAGYQKHQRGPRLTNRINYTFPNFIPYPRGIRAQFHEDLLSISADYAFPLFYPDWSLPPILYLQRLSMNLFADYAWGERWETPENGESVRVGETFNTFGVDVTGNMHLLRFLAPITLGGRIAFEPATGNFTYQLIYGISF